MDAADPATLRLAKKGDLNAIATLINHALSAHGVTVFSLSISADWLDIELQSQVSPIDPKIIDRVKHGAEKLQIKTVKRVQVSEIDTGNVSPPEENPFDPLPTLITASNHSQSAEQSDANEPAEQSDVYLAKPAPSNAAAKQKLTLASAMAFVGSGGVVIILVVLGGLGVLGVTHYLANSSNNREDTTAETEPIPNADAAEGQPSADAGATPNSSAPSAALVSSPQRVDVLKGIHSFDGATDYVQAPLYVALNFGTGDFSISAWIKTNSQSGIEIIVDKRVETSGPVQGYVLATYNGGLLLQLADAGGWTNYINPVPIADDEWHHIAITVDRDDASGIRWYLDGYPVGGTANPTGRSGDLSTSQPLFIGRRSDHPGWPGFFNGQLADIALFNTRLTAEEVAELVNSTIFQR